ncbi:MAG: ATP-binding protein [Gammaproteobacteria bacterium]
MKSIRRTLLVTLLVGMSTVMIIGAYATYRVARNEANTIFDYYLRQIALSFRDQRFKLNPRVNIPDEKDFDFVIRVWNVDGVTVYYSRPHRSLPNLTKLGYSTVKTPDGTWRVYAIQYLDETVEVAQPLSVRDTQAASAALRTLTPFMFLLPLLGLLIWFIVDRGLRPLTQLTRAVLTRTPDSLEPLDEAASSKEVQPLILALNELLARLQSALEVQRAFIADAAHELRTPLTALQLQIQLVERAKDENQRDAALSELKSGLERTTHVIQQLLTLARQDPANLDSSTESVDLIALIHDIVIQHQPLAQAKQIDLGISRAPEQATLQCNSDSLRIMLANLVSNALRYTPEGGKVDIFISQDPHFQISICDSGPGIPDEEKTRVFDRFYRRSGNAESGSGLGLAIVKSIADRIRATITLKDNPGGGLCANIEFLHKN